MPEMIRNDNGELAGYIYVDLAGRHRRRTTSSGRASICATNLTLPPGYSIEWTGLYQYAEDARATLRVVVPMTLVIMFGAAGGGVPIGRAKASLIMLSVPFAMVGGVFLQWLLGLLDDDGRDRRLHLAVRRRRPDRHHHGRSSSARRSTHRTAEQSYIDAVVEGSAARLRPKLMTVAATVLSLLPVMFVDRVRAWTS